jgi:hypothetical protein
MGVEEMGKPVEGKPSRFSREAWLAMGFALLLLMIGVGQLLYRYTLPTDGWSVYTEEIAETIFLYDRNLVGAASGIKTADGILAVDGMPLQGSATSEYIPTPSGWQVGQNVMMRVQRGEEEIEIAVPVVHWTGMAIIRHNVLYLSHLASMIGALLMLVIGWFTFLRRPEVPSARALLILSTTIGVTFISGTLPDGLSVQFDQAAFWLTIFYSYAIFGTLLAPSLFVFTLLFPRPKQIIQRHPWLALLPFVYGGLLLLFLVGGGPAEVGWFSTMAMFALSIISLIHAGFTQRDTVSQAQLRWAVASFVVGLGLFMLTFPLAFNWITNPALINAFLIIPSLGFVVIGTGLALAVLRYRLYDIDIIIRKTLVYVVLTALLALVYFGLVILLQSVFESISGQQSPIVIVISTLVIAALFAPLRRQVQDFIDRRFFRKKYDAQQVLAQFAQTARDETDMDMLTAELVSVVQETIQPEFISVWLKPVRSSRRPFS